MHAEGRFIASSRDAPQRFFTAMTAVALGVSVWMTFSAGPVMEDAFIRFAFSTTAAAIVLIVATGVALRTTGLWFVIGPVILAPWTASRGDGDGLWVLQFFYLGLLGVWLSAIASGVGKLVPSSLMRTRAWRGSLQLAIVISALISASFLVFVRWPNPWPGLIAEMNGFRLEGFAEKATTMDGSALCYQSCGPSVTRTFDTNLPRTLACDALEQAVRDHGTRITEASACYVRGELVGGPLGTLLITGLGEQDTSSRVELSLTLEARRRGSEQ